MLESCSVRSPSGRASGINSRNIIDHLLRIDSRNQYVFYYRDREFLGRYAGHPNVRERFILAPNKAIWDQICIPRAAHEAGSAFHRPYRRVFRCRWHAI